MNANFKNGDLVQLSRTYGWKGIVEDEEYDSVGIVNKKQGDFRVTWITDPKPFRGVSHHTADRDSLIPANLTKAEQSAIRLLLLMGIDK